MANFGIAVIWIIFGIIVLVATLVIILEITGKKKDKIPANANLIENYTNQAKNYRYGIELDRYSGVGGRTAVKFKPYDVNTESLEDVPEQIVIVDKGKAKPIPKGEFSKDRNIVRLLPPKIQDLENLYLDEDTKNLLQISTEIKNIDNDKFKMLDISDALRNRAINQIAGREWALLLGGQERELIEFIRGIGSDTSQPQSGTGNVKK